ncbi:DAHL domain-containing protein [Moorena sp. SIO4G3]|uniref:DAHL domain-containing protein n=1 Tax=Moorena sp. SIO4G3 TaxID=2607821 RepID=UPI0025F06696|nr:DAHL domain-containing protein [Moorena sp. SIO4G3]
MNTTQVLKLINTLAAVFILAFLVKKSLPIKVEEHQQYKNTLNQQKEIDVILNQDILKSRSDILTYYDPFFKHLYQLKNTQNELKSIPTFINHDGRKELNKILQSNLELINEKERLIERLKFHNSILKNSIIYLPFLTKDLVNSTYNKTINHYLEFTLDELLKNILLYNLNSDQELEALINDNMDMLLEIKDQNDFGKDEEFIDLALSHTRKIMSNKPQVDELTQQLLQLPTKQLNEELDYVYNIYYNQAIDTANTYRLYAYSLLLILLAWIAYLIINKLVKANRRTINILESITDAFIALNDQWQITYLNPQAFQMLQSQPEQLLNQNLEEVFSGVFGSKFYQECHRAVAAQVVVTFEEYYPPTKRWFDVKAYPGINGLSVFFHDITQRKQASRVLQQLNEDLEARVEERTVQLAESMKEAEKARNKSEEANKAKSEFLANMSHELRTPLNAILGFTQLMNRDSSLNQEHQEYLAIISRSGEHLLNLINDILEMSKIEAGQITLNETSFDLYRLLDSLEEMLRLRAASKGLQLIFYREPELPRYVKTDEGKLRQVLINLLGNAIKFTQEGSVTLRVVRNNEKLKVDRSDPLNVDRLNVDRSDPLKVDRSDPLNVDRLNVDRSDPLKVDRSDPLNVDRLNVDRSDPLKVDRLNVVRVRAGSAEGHAFAVGDAEAWPFGHGFPNNQQLATPTNLQPTNLQPTNLQPTNLQPTNLQPANLQPTNLQPANLQPANLQPANLGQKATLSAKPTLREREQPATLTRQTITFEIEDTGPGVDPAEIDSLFEAFVQTEIGRKSEQGTGLGLSISRQFVKLMGGDITLTSPLGGGTIVTFDIQISLAGAGADIQTQHPTRSVIGLAPDQPKYRILVVEDKWESRKLLVKLLEPLGFEVREAENGKEGVALWSSWEPHLIWMDMRMPVMDGYEATKQIKAHLKGQATVIIALTASAFIEERAVILSAGCDDFVRKPFREEEIFETMAHYLGVRYVYEEETSATLPQKSATEALTREALAVMPAEWVAQLYQAANEVNNQRIFQLIEQIPSEHDPVAIALTDLVRNFRCDKIIDLTEPAIS